MKIKSITLCAVFVAVAMIMYIVENQIPVPIPIPGLKLGISNVITLVTLYLWDKKHSMIILILRILLSSVICGSGLTFIYSLSGGILSFVSICISKKILKQNMIPVISVIGAAFHNTGQIMAAIFILKSTSIIVYLPVLILLSLITGAITGTGAYFMIKNNYINNLFRSV